MTTDTTHWTPPRTFALDELLRHGVLGELGVGSSSDQIEVQLGPPQIPPGPVDRKRRVWCWTYGNVSVLVSHRRVDAIQIDFEGSRPKMVSAGSIAQWSFENWRAFAEREGWHIREQAGIIQLVGPHATVCISPEGQLQVVSLWSLASTIT